MKELKLVLDPKIAARVALALRRYALEQQDKLIDTVAAAIETKLGGRRGRYNQATLDASGGVTDSDWPTSRAGEFESSLPSPASCQNG